MGADTRGSGALHSGLDILEVLATESRGLGVSEIARRTGLDKGNAHRILRSLESRGYVEQDPTSKRYTASAFVLALARTVLHGIDLVTAAQTEMQALSDRTGESVHMAKRTRSGGVYVAQFRQPGRISVETEIGAQPIVHATATGKALYCQDSGVALEQVLDLPLIQFTERTVGSIPVLMEELRRTRERGYAIDDEELTLDVRCVAAPIYDIYGVVTACVGISGPTTRVPPERLGELGEEVRLAAITITNNVGGRLPSLNDAHPRSSMEVHQ